MKQLKRGPTPYYHQIETILRSRIAAGDLRVGDRVPTEEQLCGMYGVSRATVRHAMQKLEQDGIVERQAGRGTFVRSVGSHVAELKMTCVLEDLIALGIPAESSLANSGVIQAAPPVAQALGLADGDYVFSFQKILSVDGEPFLARRFYLPVWMGDRLTREDMRRENLLQTLARRLGVDVLEADQVIEAVMADTTQADVLAVPAGTALLSVSRTSYGRNRLPVEYSVTLYRSDRVRFFISQRQRKAGSEDWVLAARGVRNIEKSRRPDHVRR